MLDMNSILLVFPENIRAQQELAALNRLEKKNFFTPKEKKHSMLMNINNLIYRLEPNDKELRILASIISTLSKKKYESLIDK